MMKKIQMPGTALSVSPLCMGTANFGGRLQQDDAERYLEYYFSQGALDGLWLYTWAKISHMEWTDEGMKATLTSNEEQKLTIRCRKPDCKIFINGKICGKDGDHTAYAFQKGETVEIEIKF